MGDYNYYSQIQTIISNQEEIIENQVLLKNELLNLKKDFSSISMCICLLVCIFFWIKTFSVFLGKKNL